MINSSFGQQILGQSAQDAGQNIAAIPTNMTNQFLAGAVPTVASAGTGALSQAAGLNTSGTTTQTPSFMSYLMQGLQAGATAVSGTAL